MCVAGIATDGDLSFVGYSSKASETVLTITVRFGLQRQPKDTLNVEQKIRHANIFTILYDIGIISPCMPWQPPSSGLNTHLRGRWRAPYPLQVSLLWPSWPSSRTAP